MWFDVESEFDLEKKEKYATEKIFNAFRSRWCTKKQRAPACASVQCDRDAWLSYDEGTAHEHSTYTHEYDMNSSCAAKCGGVCGFDYVSM